MDQHQHLLCKCGQIQQGRGACSHSALSAPCGPSNADSQVPTDCGGWGRTGRGGAGLGGLLKHLSPEAFFPGTLFHLLLLFSQTPYLNAKVATPQCPPNSSLHPKLSLASLSGAATPAMGQEWGKVASGSEPAPRSPQSAPRRSQPEGGHAAG